MVFIVWPATWLSGPVPSWDEASYYYVADFNPDFKYNASR